MKRMYVLTLALIACLLLSAGLAAAQPHILPPFSDRPDCRLREKRPRSQGWDGDGLERSHQPLCAIRHHGRLGPERDASRHLHLGFYQPAQSRSFPVFEGKAKGDHLPLYDPIKCDKTAS